MSADLAVAVLALRADPRLADALRSLLDQDTEAELVVVNSGGGDAAAVVRGAGLDVPVVERDERLFPGAVRNLGIDATSAPYVAFLAADCLARPGWIAERLRAHREGVAAVASTLENASPESRWATAAWLFHHHRTGPYASPSRRLLYGLSLERSVFERRGRFREDLRAGEDTEFRERLAGERVEWAPGVRTAHRYATDASGALADAHRRGRLDAAMFGRLRGRQYRLSIAAGAPAQAAGALAAARRAPAHERKRLLAAQPLLVPVAAAYAAGALSSSPRARATARWDRRSGSG